MKAGKRLPQLAERRARAIDSMANGTIGGHSHIGMPVAEAIRNPLATPGTHYCPELLGTPTRDALRIAVSSDEAYIALIETNIYRNTLPALGSEATFRTAPAGRALSAPCGDGAGNLVWFEYATGTFTPGVGFSSTTIWLYRMAFTNPGGTPTQLWTASGVDLLSGVETYEPPLQMAYNPTDGLLYAAMRFANTPSLVRVDPVAGGAPTQLLAGLTSNQALQIGVARDGAVWWTQGTSVHRWNGLHTTPASFATANLFSIWQSELDAVTVVDTHPTLGGGFIVTPGGIVTPDTCVDVTADDDHYRQAQLTDSGLVYLGRRRSGPLNPAIFTVGV